MTDNIQDHFLLEDNFCNTPNKNVFQLNLQTKKTKIQNFK